MGGPVTYRLEDQGALEDIANVVQGLIGMEADPGDAGEVQEAAKQLRARLTGALEKLKREARAMADEVKAPRCPNDDTVMTARRIKSGQIVLNCPKCKSRAFVTTKAAQADFEARFPGLVPGFTGKRRGDVAGSSSDATPAAGDAGKGAGAPAGSASATAEKKEDLSRIGGHRGRRLRGE